MKGAAILLGVLVAAVAVNAKCPLAEIIEKSVVECQKITDASEEVLKLVSKGEGEDKREVQCFYACLMSELGLGTDKIDIDKLEELIRKAENVEEDDVTEALEAAKECNEEVEKSDDECQLAANYVQCFREIAEDEEDEEEEGGK